MIDPATGWWNLDLIQTISNPGDAARIGSVMLSPLKREDKLVRGGTMSGLFTVRSAYYMERSRLAQDRGEWSGVDNSGEIWKTLWGLNALPVITNFCWEVCNELLPTKENLFRRKIVTDPWYPLCTAKPETIVHCLWGFPAAEAVWQEGGRKFHKMSCAPLDGKGLFTYFLEHFDPEEVVEALIVARMIWWRRNDFVFSRGFTPLAKLMFAAKSSMDRFSQTAKSEVVSPKALTRHQLEWKKLPEGCWKINWDAAIAKEALKMGVGVVIRDAEGGVVAAKVTTVPYIVEPKAAKTMAAWRAVEFGREMGASRVILEGDAQVLVVSALRATAFCNRVYGQLIEDIKESLSHFSSVEVVHVY